jgi:hypothetical protein
MASINLNLYRTNFSYLLALTIMHRCLFICIKSCASPQANLVHPAPPNPPTRRVESRFNAKIGLNLVPYGHKPKIFTVCRISF